jgi:hypothetical protein
VMDDEDADSVIRNRRRIPDAGPHGQEADRDEASFL